MTKYAELVKTYSNEIAKIKALKAKYASLVDEANAIKQVSDDGPDYDAMDRAETLYQEAEIVYQDMADKSVELQTDVEAAYATAPFAKTRDDGIAGFYKLAGLG